MSPLLPTRQIHLDFHTGPAIPDVGTHFNPNAFGDALLAAHVNSITLFAKCHHGHLYYDTSRPERHPGLSRNVHLLEGQIEACRSRGIKTPIYISVQCDEYAANTHPEWVCRNPDGTNVGRKPLGNDPFQWQILDMSSPYADFLAEQIAEVVGKFKPVDGIFLDMCWDQPSVSKWAVDAMKRAGLDPADDRDRARHARSVAVGYMARYNDLITKLNGSLPRVWHNSRPKTNLASEAKFARHIEIEALPTGGWGYTYFPLNVRWARNFGLPFIGMTARFHKSWSDFGGYKPPAALKYELSQMIAHGGGCSVGDQLHPRGVLDPEAYRLIADAYAHVEACEKVCLGTTPLTEAAVFRDPDADYSIQPGGTLEGVVRLLQQLNLQFDLLAPTADVSRYALVIVPDNVTLSPDVSARLSAYVAGGGKLMLAGPNAVKSASAELRALAGVAGVGEAESKTPFLRFDPAVVAGSPLSDIVAYDSTLYLTAAAGAVAPAGVVNPYFDRAWDRFCGHNQSPPATPTTFAAVTVTERAGAFGFDAFKSFATHGQYAIRQLFAAVLARLLPTPLIRATSPTHAELSVATGPGRTLLHVVSYAPQRRTPTLDIVEEATPLVGLKVAIRAQTATPPTKVTRHPGGAAVPFTFEGGYVAFELSSNQGHDVLVIE